MPCADTDLVAGVVPGAGFVLQSRVAGAAAAQQSPPQAAATTRGRPITGSLVADDGAVYPLDRAYIIGRNPMIDPAVSNATASPISLPDDPQVSRVHAHVTVHGNLVLVRDAQTAGGTYIAAPGDQVAQVRFVVEDQRPASFQFASSVVVVVAGVWLAA